MNTQSQGEITTLEPFPAATVAQPVSPPAGGDDQLEQILPQLRELAQKVGGFGKLAEIVRELDRGA
jgi:hypothetical protein